MTISVVVAEDQAVVRAGIVMLLEAEPDIQVVGEAGDGQQAIDIAETLRPDIVLMDIRMPGIDGVAATRIMCSDPNREHADHLTKILVLTTFSDDDAVYGSLQAGASGFLLKHAAPHDLITAIRRVAAGDAWIDPAIAPKVISALSGRARKFCWGYVQAVGSPR